MAEYNEEDDIKYGPPDPGSRSDEIDKEMDFKNLPRLNGDEKPMIGPTRDGQIKVVYKSQIEGRGAWF